MDLVLQAASSSYKLTYNPGTLYENFTTHSEFGTYITNVGLYNDYMQGLQIFSGSSENVGNPEQLTRR